MKRGSPPLVIREMQINALPHRHRDGGNPGRRQRHVSGSMWDVGTPVQPQEACKTRLPLCKAAGGLCGCSQTCLLWTPLSHPAALFVIRVRKVSSSLRLWRNLATLAFRVRVVLFIIFKSLSRWNLRCCGIRGVDPVTFLRVPVVILMACIKNQSPPTPHPHHRSGGLDTLRLLHIAS